jgi:hypothetical protein
VEACQGRTQTRRGIGEQGRGKHQQGQDRSLGEFACSLFGQSAANTRLLQTHSQTAAPVIERVPASLPPTTTTAKGKEKATVANSDVEPVGCLQAARIAVRNRIANLISINSRATRSWCDLDEVCLVWFVWYGGYSILIDSFWLRSKDAHLSFAEFASKAEKESQDVFAQPSALPEECAVAWFAMHGGSEDDSLAAIRALWVAELFPASPTPPAGPKPMTPCISYSAAAQRAIPKIKIVKPRAPASAPFVDNDPDDSKFLAKKREQDRRKQRLVRSQQKLAAEEQRRQDLQDHRKYGPIVAAKEAAERERKESARMAARQRSLNKHMDWRFSVPFLVAKFEGTANHLGRDRIAFDSSTTGRALMVRFRQLIIRHCIAFM